MTATSTRAKRAQSPFGSQVARRYVDAYRVAVRLHAIGQALKAVGVLLALATFAALELSTGSVLVGVLGGVVAAVTGFVGGVVVEGQAELLLTTVDTAVHSSPFISNEERARIMELSPDTPPGAEEYSQGSPNVGPATPFCYHCGAEVPEGASVCTKCGKDL